MKKSSKQLKMLDLFSGAGGMTLGFVRAGFESVAAVERETVFARTYEANFGSHVYTGNIEDSMPELKKLRADVVIGGPPCQGFSNPPKLAECLARHIATAREGIMVK